MKILNQMPGNKLNGMHVKMEAFHQHVLASQRAVEVEMKEHRKSKVADICGTKIVVMRKRYEK